MKSIKVKKMVMVAVFSAISFALQMIAPFPKVGGFLEIEFSDLPALIRAFAYGPVAGLLTELIKNLLHLTVSTTGFVGELANFVVNGIFVMVAGLIYMKHKGPSWRLAAQSCLTLWDSTDCSPPGSSLHGILQARILDGLPLPSPGDLPNPGIE